MVLIFRLPWCHTEFRIVIIQRVLEVSPLAARLFPDADGKPLISGSTVGEISIKLPLDEAAVLQTLIDPRVPGDATVFS